MRHIDRKLKSCWDPSSQDEYSLYSAIYCDASSGFFIILPFLFLYGHILQKQEAWEKIEAQIKKNSKRDARSTCINVHPIRLSRVRIHGKTSLFWSFLILLLLLLLPFSQIFWRFQVTSYALQWRMCTILHPTSRVIVNHGPYLCLVQIFVGHFWISIVTDYLVIVLVQLLEGLSHFVGMYFIEPDGTSFSYITSVSQVQSTLANLRKIFFGLVMCMALFLPFWNWHLAKLGNSSILAIIRTYKG